MIRRKKNIDEEKILPFLEYNFTFKECFIIVDDGSLCSNDKMKGICRKSKLSFV